jgi:hypothetical protein
MGVSMSEVKIHAKKLGISSPDQFKKKEDIIHAIQRAEGCNTCFNKIDDCPEKICKWFDDCQKWV